MKPNNPWGSTPFFAAHTGDYSELRRILAQGVDPNVCDHMGHLPLAHAASHSRLEMIELLLAAGANAAPPEGIAPPLSYAKDAAIAERLIAAGAEVDAVSRAEYGFHTERTALMQAASAGNWEIVGLLLRYHARLDLRDRDGRTALHLAAAYGHAQVIEALLAAGAPVGLSEAALLGDTDKLKKMLDGEPPPSSAAITHAFFASVQFGSPETVTLLLEHGADVNALAARGSLTPLILAVRRPAPELVRILLAHDADKETLDGAGQTALHSAVSPRNPRGLEIAGILLDAGANVDCRVRYRHVPQETGRPGTTPLMRAASTGNIEIIQLLVRHGADPNLRDASGRTALQIASNGRNHQAAVDALQKAGAVVGLIEAAQMGDNDKMMVLVEQASDPQSDEMAQAFRYAAGSCGAGVVTRMVELGVPVDARSIRDETALMRAAYCDRIDIGRLLIDRGANVNAANFTEGVALHRCHSSPDFARMLLAAGAEIDSRNHLGFTPLMVAAQRGTDECVRVLIEAGAGVNHRNNQGVTALMFAALFGSEAAIGMLAAAGADMEVVNDLDENGGGGRTALMFAVLKSRAAAAQALLDAGANTENQGLKHETPLTIALRIAEKSGDTTIVDLLRAAGASA
ncbi:MAG: uncharacterized protein JWQ02_2730 [Capsulimonas sp.]|nr:uncharacterized protein [Capsulimonas sp.]